MQNLCISLQIITTILYNLHKNVLRSRMRTAKRRERSYISGTHLQKKQKHRAICKGIILYE